MKINTIEGSKGVSNTLSKVQQVDTNIDENLDSLSSSLNQRQSLMLEELRRDLNILKRYARLAAAKLSTDKGSNNGEQDKAAEKALEDYSDAAVQISRDVHKYSGRPMDIVKSLFMWKESPEEHQSHK